MNRVDLYTTIHKGLRAALFNASATVAKTDFSRVAEAKEAAQTVRHVLGLLEDHAAHEDAVMMPVLAELSSEVFTELQADHSRLTGLANDIQASLQHIESSPTAERVARGARLHGRMGRLTAEHLLHMDREEVTANRVLWAHRTDEQLLALHGRILSSIPPTRLSAMARVALCAVSEPERAVMLRGLSVVVPAALYDQLVALERQTPRVGPAIPSAALPA